MGEEVKRVMSEEVGGGEAWSLDEFVSSGTGPC